MKKISVWAILVMAMASMAMNYTGYVYLSSNSEYATYLSVGCNAKNADGDVTSIGTSDIVLVQKDVYGWYKIPVSDLLVDGTLADFCFYQGYKTSKIVSLYDGDEYIGSKTVYYYPSSKTFSEKDFANQKDLYLGFSGYIYHSIPVEPPTVFFKSNWKTNYVVLDGYQFIRLNNKNSNGWTVVHDEFKSNYIRRDIKIDSVQKMRYGVNVHCLEDDEGECLYDDITGKPITVRDTVDSIMVWVYTYDTLSIDTLYRTYDGTIVFTDSNQYCGGHFTYKSLFNVGGSSMDTYYCMNQNLGIQVDKSIYVFENPKKANKTLIRTKEPESAKTLHVLPPQVSSWFGETPALAVDGGESYTALKVEPGHCGWYSTLFFEEEIPTRASFTGLVNKTLKFGKIANVDSLFNKLNTNELYYVADDPSKIFWYATNPGYEGICEVHLQGIVYDTDADLHPAFSCYSQGGEGCQKGAQDVSLTTAITAINACIGVTPGVVEDTLGRDHKPVLSKAGEKCFISSDFFNQLFNPTDGVNETSCSVIPFTLNASGKWEFSSDYFLSPGAPAIGGYYPVELTEDKDIVVGEPVEVARTKHLAEGPVFVGPELRAVDEKEGVMKMDLLCNGPGWNKGIDCAGLFADGEDLAKEAAGYLDYNGSSTLCVWGWSCPNQAPEDWTFFDSYETVAPRTSGNPRWVSTIGRNQHFCFESHAKFTYRKGLRFGVRGDDDIWIFIGGKLAIDLGGTHLAAPGYADLSRLTDRDDNPLVVGQTYDIDIFFCDRRTTMSNMNIYSNFYLDQSESQSRMRPCKVNVEHIFDDDPLSPGRVTATEMTVAAPSRVNVGVEGLRVEVSGLSANEPVALFDLQGRVIAKRHASTSNMWIDVKNAGRYIVKTKTGRTVVTVK